MLRIETAIKDSRFFCSSALLRDRFLKLIRSSSQFSTLQFTRDSSLCSCRFGLLIVKAKTTSFQAGEYKKKNPGLSRVWPGRPGPGSTRRAGPSFKTLLPTIKNIDFVVDKFVKQSLMEIILLFNHVKKKTEQSF